MSSTIEFYFMPMSAPCRAVEMVASLVGVTLNKHYINLLSREQFKEDFVKLNPAHQVPFIVDGDLKMGESRAIMAYLVNQYAPADCTLYPSNPKLRAKIDELQFFDSGSLTKAMYKVFLPYFQGPVKELDAEAAKEFSGKLQLVEDHLTATGNKFYFGNDLTIADVGLMSSMAFPEVCGFDLTTFKSFYAYLNRVKAAIPQYKAINETAIEDLRALIRSKQEQPASS